MIETVQNNLPLWQRSPDRNLRLRGAFVSAEIFDYYGMYADARAALEPYSVSAIVEQLRTQGKRLDDTQLKRQFWLALALAQADYRDEYYPKSLDTLRECLEILTELDPDSARLHGTRARLLHGMAQNHRQLSDYATAMRCFGESIESANHRLIKKTDFAEFVEPEVLVQSPLSKEQQADRLVYEQKLANWSIAKTLALGIAWIYFATGRLSDASRCLAVGAALLRSTHDSTHRAYCALLSAAVERGRHGDDPAKLKLVIPAMQRAAIGLNDHPVLRVRAEYEFALACLHTGDLEGASAAIAKVDKSLGKAKGEGLRSARWECTSLILKSRLQRLEGNPLVALRHADKAEDRARDAGQRGLMAEALIASSEALQQMKNRESVEQAGSRLRRARELVPTNPKTAATCSLHLAGVELDLGRPTAARDEFKRWETDYKPHIEHGFLKGLAARVERRLWSSDGELKLDGMNIKHNALLLKKHLVSKVWEMQGLTLDQKGDLLGCTGKQFDRLAKEYGLKESARLPS
jgi:tetratricopeptide (TPR) repeat protein